MGTNLLVSYTGAYQDPMTGAYPLGNGYRMYLPEQMRFAQPDSMSPFGRGGVNPYAYCEADPINRSDPAGHFGILGILGAAALLPFNLVPGLGEAADIVFGVVDVAAAGEEAADVELAVARTASAEEEASPETATYSRRIVGEAEPRPLMSGRPEEPGEPGPSASSNRAALQGARNMRQRPVPQREEELGESRDTIIQARSRIDSLNEQLLEDGSPSVRQLWGRGDFEGAQAELNRRWTPQIQLELLRIRRRLNGAQHMAEILNSNDSPDPVWVNPINPEYSINPEWEGIRWQANGLMTRLNALRDELEQIRNWS